MSRGNYLDDGTQKILGDKRKLSDLCRYQFRKGIGRLILGAVLLFCLAAAKADICEAAVINSDNNLCTQDENGDYSFCFTFENDRAYAGSEFCISCSEGVRVKEVSYDGQFTNVGPTEARGYTWFGFFSTGNEIDKPVEITVSVECSSPETEESMKETPHLIVAETKVYFVENGEYVTEEIIPDALFYFVQKDEEGKAVIPFEEMEKEEAKATEDSEKDVSMDESDNESTVSAGMIRLIIPAAMFAMIAVFIYLTYMRKKRRK